MPPTCRALRDPDGLGPGERPAAFPDQEAFPNARVLNVYGTTEAGPVVFGPDPQGRPKPDAALGWPQPGVELKLVEREPLAAHATVMLGYLNDPERTAAVLTPEGWYKSGDVFRRDENGCYWFVGRTDDMFVSGGENIFPSEVELVLARATPMSRRLASCRCRTRSRAPSRWPSSCRAQAAIRTKKRSSASCSPMRPRTSIREGCSSCPSCRSPAPTRSIARLWNKGQ